MIAPQKPLGSRAKKPRPKESAPIREIGVAPGSGPQPDSQRIFLHDVVNQLTVISLACFELRYPTAEQWNESQRKAIDAIETAVHNAAAVMNQLSKMLKEPPAQKAVSPSEPAPERTHPLHNIYPISPFLNRR